MTKTSMILVVLAVCSVGFDLQAQDNGHPIPHLVQKDGRYALFVDGAPFLMLGAQANNSSDWPATLPKVWPAIEYLHANTLEIPIYWEQFEPQPGQFDYTAVDTILAQAREHHVHLVLLWFGTWKNGSQHYMPEWMKREPERYFHVINKNGELVDSPSPFAAASLEADNACVHRVHAAPQSRRSGTNRADGAGGKRNRHLGQRSAIIRRRRKSSLPRPVPAEVLKAMGQEARDATPQVGRKSSVPRPKCTSMPGRLPVTCGQVAAAGKAVYPLPLYANAALRDPLKPGAPGSYESGGPTDNVIPIWKAEAPAIDILAPDIYLSDTRSVSEGAGSLSSRRQCACSFPETSGSRQCGPLLLFRPRPAGHRLFALRSGLHRDTRPRTPANRRRQMSFLTPTAQNYRLIGPMMRDVARLNFEGKLQAVGGSERSTDPNPPLRIVGRGGFLRSGPATVAAKGNPEPVGRALVAQLEGRTSFCVTGLISAASTFQSAPIAEISIANSCGWKKAPTKTASFKFMRILNGDRNGLGTQLLCGT